MANLSAHQQAKVRLNKDRLNAVIDHAIATKAEGENMTVQGLCDLSGIARMTFYSSEHYEAERERYRAHLAKPSQADRFRAVLDKHEVLGTYPESMTQICEEAGISTSIPYSKGFKKLRARAERMLPTNRRGQKPGSNQPKISPYGRAELLGLIQRCENGQVNTQAIPGSLLQFCKACGAPDQAIHAPHNADLKERANKLLEFKRIDAENKAKLRQIQQARLEQQKRAKRESWLSFG